MTDARVLEAPARRKLKCPRCGRVAFIDRYAGGIGARCPSCGGTHLSADDVEQVISHELGLSTGELRARATHASDDDLGGCSSCKGALSRAVLEDVRVELCLRCGAGWLDPGELERLTHGRHLERQPPGEVARQHLPVGLKRAGRGKVSVPGPRKALRGAGVAILSGALLGALAGVEAGSVVLGVVTGGFFSVVAACGGLIYLVGRPRVVVDLEADTVRSVNVGGLPAAQTTRIADIRAVAIMCRQVVVPSEGRMRPQWDVVPRGEAVEGRLFLTLGSRMLAHRVAFQLSQLLEVPVETPRDP